MSPDDEIKALRKRISNQRRELRRLNKYLGPYWAGFSHGINLEAECRLRGIMNATFGHERVRAAEMAAAERRHTSAVVKPGEQKPDGWFRWIGKWL